MVRKRTPEKSIDDFIEGAEKDANWKQEDTTSETVDFSADAKERVRARAKASRKGGIYTIQATRSQKKLMVHAAEQLDISQAKLLERYFFTALEEQFGVDVPITKE